MLEKGVNKDIKEEKVMFYYPKNDVIKVWSNVIRFN